MKNMTPQEAYKILQDASGIKQGDTVKILRSAATHEMGWWNGWTTDMSAQVGKTAKVIRICSDIVLDTPHQEGYPFFILQVIKSAPKSILIKLNAEYTAEVFTDIVIVGCQIFPISVIDELATAVAEIKKQ